MKHHALPTPPAPAAAPQRASWLAAWGQFWFAPANPLGLHACRVLAGLLFLAWLLPFAGQLDSLFGLSGWFDRQAYREMARLVEEAPQQIGWSFLFAVGGSSLALQIVYWLSVAVVAAFTLGLAPRFTGLLSWVVLVSFSVNPALEYDGDVFLVVLAFYLMLGYLLAGVRPGETWRGFLFASAWPLGRACQASRGANLALRLFQVHFALVLVTSGLHKLQFGDWWGGVALWYPLVPAGETTLAQARALTDSPETLLFWLSAAAYAVIGWQLLFPLFAWRPGCRWLLLGGAVAGWLGTALLYQLPLIGPALLVSCLAYVSGDEWQRWLGRAWQTLARRKARVVQVVEEPVEVGTPG